MFRLVSDVHLEFMKPERAAAWAAQCVPQEGQTVLVIAGDLGSFLNSRGRLQSELVSALERLAAQWPHVVYVPGNHEYYGTLRHHMSFEQAEALIRAECDRLGVVFLQRRAWQVPGTDLTLVGCTLWTDVSSKERTAMNDVNYVSEDPSLVFQDHLAWLIEEVPKHAKVVVVTHHLPSLACVHPTYRSYPDQTGYATELIDRCPALFLPPVVGWMHGHSHESMDVVVGRVRVVSNPTGYPGERKVTHATTDTVVFN
jgi:Calcineurin-like phosphoesterase